MLRGPRRERGGKGSRNPGGSRIEAHLICQAVGKDTMRVPFAWRDGRGERRDTNIIPAAGEEEAARTLPTGKGVQTRWVEFELVPPR
jgi:hypothetical protein